MRRLSFSVCIISLLLIIFGLTAHATENPYPHPRTDKYWVYFSDKGDFSAEEIAHLLDRLEAEAGPAELKRRSLANPGKRLFDYSDLPVYSIYMNKVTSYGVRIHRSSRWLNAVSVSGRMDLIRSLEDLPYVDSITTVKVYRREVRQAGEVDYVFPKPTSPTQLDYGDSFDQLNQIQVPSLHALGLTGAGVTIAVFDTGFDTAHAAFNEMDIKATYDFINDDSDVVDVFNAQRSHGTSVLAAMGGWAPGELIGPAYGATYCLAKTEDYYDEYQGEEDNFIAALEWADTLGCQIVSASLGYIDWYSPSDLDGNTAAITIACDAAVARGIAVIVAAGNEGPGATTLLTPADGDSVIAVGGVLITDQIWYSSSRGPTADGRIKPDICANSVQVKVASYTGGFKRGNGTSYATPLTAGAAALVLEANPTYSAVDLRQVLRSTARAPQGENVTLPNNEYGYGIVDAKAAAGVDPVVSDEKVLAYPNPFEDLVSVSCQVEGNGILRGSIHSLDGIQVWKHEVSVGNGAHELDWDGRNDDGEEVAAGVYLMRVTAPGIEETIKLFKVK